MLAEGWVEGGQGHPQVKNRFLSARCPTKKSVGRSGNLCFLIFSFLLTTIYRRYEGGVELFLKKTWKKSFSRPFLVQSGGGQETTFYLRVAQGSKDQPQGFINI